MVRLALLALAAMVPASALTDLYVRGYSVVPTPQKVTLGESDVAVPGWRLEGDGQGIAARFLKADFGVAEAAGGLPVVLAVRAGAVPGAGAAVAAQAYRLEIAASGIRITGNGAPGLLYGVQTLTQLARRDASGRVRLPAVVIEDWPSFEWRFLHWDSKHHQDRIETLQRYIDQAVRFKINRIGFELEDKFEYPSVPDVGAPGAYTTAELQALVKYGLERHVQLVPVIQSPAHMAYVLKHPRYADLKADGNNYQIAMCDPRAYPLIFKMYEDVIRAFPGGDAFFVSTDEVYYAGIDKGCAKPYNEENRSLQWLEFANKAAEFLAARGRRMLAWVEYPVLPQHAGLLPKGIVDGVVGEPEFLAAEKKLGIRQLGYHAHQGAEFLFPDNFDYLQPDGQLRRGHLAGNRERIRNGMHRRGDPIGIFGAAWDDSGPHGETFWLGWSLTAQYGWNVDGPEVEEHAASFMRAFYGAGNEGLLDAYRTLQYQARAWQNSWDREVSKVRGPGYGNSYGKGIGVVRYDQTLAVPPLPDAELGYTPAFRAKYAERVALAHKLAVENEQLRYTLTAAVGKVERNRYNLEVFGSLTRFIAQQWQLLLALEAAEGSLSQAAGAAKGGRHAQAVGRAVAAFNGVRRQQADSRAAFDGLKAVYEKSRYPQGRTVNGRAFLQVLDDTKDHWAGRRADLSYLRAPEESLQLNAWLTALRGTIEAYAKKHNVPVKGLAEARLEE